MMWWEGMLIDGEKTALYELKGQWWWRRLPAVNSEYTSLPSHFAGTILFTGDHFALWLLGSPNYKMSSLLLIIINYLHVAYFFLELPNLVASGGSSSGSLTSLLLICLFTLTDNVCFMCYKEEFFLCDKITNVNLDLISFYALQNYKWIWFDSSSVIWLLCPRVNIHICSNEN